MIDFSRTIDDVVLDCDQEPKTVFRIRSLNFDDDLWIREELKKLGDYPVASVARLLKKWREEGTDSTLSPEESKALDEVSAFWSERERLRCIRGVIEIDRKQVTPDEVEAKIGELPSVLRAQVQSELAGKIEALGAPSPKSEPQSGSPLGHGRIPITPAGGVSSAR